MPLCSLDPLSTNKSPLSKTCFLNDTSFVTSSEVRTRRSFHSLNTLYRAGSEVCFCLLNLITVCRPRYRGNSGNWRCHQTFTDRMQITEAITALNTHQKQADIQITNIHISSLCCRSCILVVRPAAARPCPSRVLLLHSRAPPPSASPCSTVWVEVWVTVWGPSVRLAAPLFPWWAGSWRPLQEVLSSLWTVCLAVWTVWSSLPCRTPLSPHSLLCVPNLRHSTPRRWHRASSFPRVWARTFPVCL